MAKKMSKLINICVICIVLVAITTWGCGCNKPTKVKDDNNEIISVKVSKVTQLNIKDRITITGSLIPNEKVIISNKKAGRVNKYYVDMGDYVKQGQILAQISPVDYQLQYNESMARQESTQAILEGVNLLNIEEHSLVRQAKASLDDSKIHMERLKKLADSKLIPLQDYDSARANYLANLASYENKLATIKKMSKDLNAQKASTGISAQAVYDTSVTAPMSGYVQKRNVSIGEYLPQYTEMFEIVQNNPLKIDAKIPEKYALLIHKSQTVTFSVESYPNKNFTAVITRVAPALDEKTRTLEIEMKVNNENNELKSGLFTDITIDLGTEHKGLFIPETAVYTTVGLNKVFVINGNKVTEHLVKLGDFVDDKVEIINEIKLSDKVVSTNVDKLSNGLEVNVVNSKDNKN